MAVAHQLWLPTVHAGVQQHGPAEVQAGLQLGHVQVRPQARSTLAVHGGQDGGDHQVGVGVGTRRAELHPVGLRAGFADAPATFRKTKVAQYVDSSPNLEARVLGGVLTSGPIERNITVNLVALRALNGANDEETKSVRRYLLALTLIAATAEIDLFLREGCHLRYADDDVWGAIPRRGAIEPIDLSSDSAQKSLLDYAKEATEPFRKQWPTELIYKFNLNKAKKLLAKKSEDEESPA